MARLTAKERAWVVEVNAVLARCPSPQKIGFYTVGDSSLLLYDLRRVDDVMAAFDGRNRSDWCIAVQDVGAEFTETIEFPSPVESTAG